MPFISRTPEKAKKARHGIGNRILEALRGKAHIDTDENGTISLQELADYVKEQMQSLRF